MNEPALKLYVYAPNARFVFPYIERELPDVELTDSPTGCDVAVMLSHVDIYGATEGENIDESAPARDAALMAQEQEFIRATGEKGIVIRTADIVGTGMGGFPMNLVRTIARGTFFHFPGNEARRSAVHASDVARFVGLLVARKGEVAHRVYNLTDMDNPTVHDLAEAFAYRLNNKRISNLSTRPQQWFGRKIYGRRLYGLYTTTLTFSAERVREEFGFEPAPVTNYLRTHIYDNDSL